MDTPVSSSLDMATQPTVKESQILEEAELELNKSPIGFVPRYVNTSLFILKPNNPCRKFFIRLVHAAWFEWFIISLILLNCLFLAMAKPHPLCCPSTTGERPDLPWLDSAVKTGFQPSPDPASTDGIVKCSSDNYLMKMNLGVSPAVGPRDEGLLSAKVWTTSASERCCVDLELEGVKPPKNEDTGKIADRPTECNDLVLDSISSSVEWVFLVAFAFEMVAKIIAQGFWFGDPDMKQGINGAYLKDPWNWLDFVVVIVAFLALLPGVANFSGLRTFRVLRPLKTMTAIPGMKTIVSSLMESAKSMGSVLLLGSSLFLLFGILGVQLFSGILEGQCYYLDQAAITAETGGWTHDGDQGSLCGLQFFPETSYGQDCRYEGFVAHNLATISGNASYTAENPLITSFPKGCRKSAHTWANGRRCSARAYGNDTWTHEAGTMVCLPNGNPNFGWSSFDNIGVAVAWIFASITLEGWVDSMYAVGNSYSDSSPFLYFIVVFYYSLMVLLCNFVMLNLALAVIADEYTEQELKEDDAREAARSKFRDKYIADGYKIIDDVAAAAAAKRAMGDKEVFPDPWGGPIPRSFYKIAINPVFNYSITGIIVLNTVVMAIESYPEDPTIAGISYALNLLFTFIFVVEMIIKMIGLGLRGYCSDGFNIFDGTVVTISLVELGIALSGGGSGGGLAILRSLRLVRVFKLARSWPDLQHLLRTILTSLMDVASASALMLLVVFIFALLGMQFFGGKWTPDAFGGGCERVNATVSCEGDDVPRANFDDIGWSIITVFQVLTGENWNDLLWSGAAAGHYNDGTAILGIGYFVILNCFGAYMIMNIFLAILLAGFEGGDDDDELEDEDPAGDINSAKVAPAPQEKYEVKDGEDGDGESDVSKRKHRIGGRTDIDTANATFHANTLVDIRESEPEMVLAGYACGWFKADSPLRIKIFHFISNPKFDAFILACIGISSAFLAMDEPWVSVCACFEGIEKQDIPVCYDQSRSIPRSFARLFPSGPVEGNSRGYYEFLVYSDLIVTVIFFFEMVLKILGLGLVMGKHSYLRNPWNRLDFVIVWVALISIATGPIVTGFCSGNSGPAVLKALRAFRALRALRPLRVVRRFPELKLVVNSIFKAMPQVLNVCMVAMLFFLIFAIMGVQFFKGKIALCNDGEMATEALCTGSFTISGSDCGMLPTGAEQDQCLLNGDTGVSFPRVWRSKAVNFDNVGNGLVTIFEIASGEMWPDIMYDTIDGVEPGKAMMENYDRGFPSVYYVLVNIVCAMIMINVFCGVIIDKYNDMKEENEGSGLLTVDQRLWVETMKLAMTGRAQSTALPPKKGCGIVPLGLRKKIFDFVTLPAFDYTIMACIGINTLFMACRHADQGPFMDNLLSTANFLFGIIFTIEAAIKLIGLGVSQYFAENWNRFDFTLVVLSWLGQVFTIGSFASLFRVLRVARMVRLLRKNRGLMDLITTVFASVPAMANVVLLLVLMMFIFSAIGMNLFSNVKHGELLNEDANFMTFFAAFNTMWRMSTGESFNGIMHDLRIAEPYCSTSAGGAVDPTEGNCGVDGVSQLYFTMMFTCLNYIFVNLCMAIILDNFGDTQALAASKIKSEHMEDFKEAWERQDPRGTNWIHETQLELVLKNVGYPMGLRDIPVEHLHATTIRKYKNRFIQSLHLSSIDGKIEFKQTKRALVEAVMGPSGELPPTVALVKEMTKQKQAIDKKMLANHKSHHVSRADIGAIERCPSGKTRISDLYGVHHTFAAKQIQAMFRQYKARFKVRKLKQVTKLVIAENNAKKE